MPWIIKEYKKDVLDIQDPMIYRDLSIPVGALDHARLADFK